MNLKTILVAVIGLCIGGGIVYALTHGHLFDNHHNNHPIADPYDSEYHVHADFHIVVNDTLVDLSGDAFQTTATQELHPDLHLHDNNGDVKHIHAEDKTFAEFLASLRITLTNTCITLDTTYCADAENVFRMYVNDVVYEGDYTTYVPVDNDRILLYYGVDDSEKIATYRNAVPDESCIYSGTCPERGIAPPESCGLTCEL